MTGSYLFALSVEGNTPITALLTWSKSLRGLHQQDIHSALDQGQGPLSLPASMASQLMFSAPDSCWPDEIGGRMTI